MTRPGAEGGAVARSLDETPRVRPAGTAPLPERSDPAQKAPTVIASAFELVTASRLPTGSSSIGTT